MAIALSSAFKYRDVIRVWKCLCKLPNSLLYRYQFVELAFRIKLVEYKVLLARLEYAVSRKVVDYHIVNAWLSEFAL